ncbi:MAG TPA: class I SAM-dependent methyltransferase [Phototrophicaceae bacterium]|nr:class I SAM-dependent methyltransferase [Phototrophicaceae bacterium]
MDDLARQTKSRWEALAAANVLYSRPLLNLDTESARQEVDPFGVMGDVRGQQVLCLASGGGQQSAALSLLGANVTVLDLSETQIERDRQALDHYGLNGTLLQGDMRDLSRFETSAFDLVWHAYSINFVPEAGVVFDQVRRVLRPGGLYRMQWSNPFLAGTDERYWSGDGYTLKHRYADSEIVDPDPYWDVHAEDGTHQRVAGPREFNHTLSTVINGLIGRSFALLGIWEAPRLAADSTPEPGTWEHYLTIAPPWLTLWARYQPA